MGLGAVKESHLGDKTSMSTKNGGVPKRQKSRRLTDACDLQIDGLFREEDSSERDSLSNSVSSSNAASERVIKIDVGRLEAENEETGPKIPFTVKKSHTKRES